MVIREKNPDSKTEIKQESLTFFKSGLKALQPTGGPFFAASHADTGSLHVRTLLVKLDNTLKIMIVIALARLFQKIFKLKKK